MATAEIAPVISSASQGLPGVTSAPDKASVFEFLFTDETEGRPDDKTEPLPADVEQVPQLTVTFSSEVPSARPEKSVLFAGSLGPTLRLQRAIPLEVSVEQEHVVLTWSETDDFACGKTTGEALGQFGNLIRELYDQLHAPGVILGADLMRIKGILDSYIITAR